MKNAYPSQTSHHCTTDVFDFDVLGDVNAVLICSCYKGSKVTRFNFKIIMLWLYQFYNIGPRTHRRRSPPLQKNRGKKSASSGELDARKSGGSQGM